MARIDKVRGVAKVVRARRRSYTEPEFRRAVRQGFSRPLPEGRFVTAEIERIIDAQA